VLDISLGEADLKRQARVDKTPKCTSSPSTQRCSSPATAQDQFLRSGPVGQGLPRPGSPGSRLGQDHRLHR
jgi:hypothetical protein